MSERTDVSASPPNTAEPVSLTEKAAREIQRILDEQGLDSATHYLRFGIQGGGCSGFEYVLGFDDAVTERDETFECRGVRIATDKKSLAFTQGTEIDFQADVMQRHFVFNNPNASRTCGCGTSFSV